MYWQITPYPVFSPLLSLYSDVGLYSILRHWWPDIQCGTGAWTVAPEVVVIVVVVMVVIGGQRATLRSKILGRRELEGAMSGVRPASSANFPGYRTWVRKIRFRIRQGIPPSVRKLAHKPRQTNGHRFWPHHFRLRRDDLVVCHFGSRFSKQTAGGITHPTEG